MSIGPDVLSTANPLSAKEINVLDNPRIGNNLTEVSNSVLIMSLNYGNFT